MSRLTANLFGLLVGVLPIVAAGGCALQPWKVGEVSHLHWHKSKPPIADRADRDLGLQIAMASRAADDQALADVMSEVRQLGESNPAAQQKLLDELAQSKPDLWPLAVQQFRSSLAYHERLVAAGEGATQVAGARRVAVATAAARPAPQPGNPQLWPGNPVPAIQASYQPPPDEASGPPKVEQALLAAPTQTAAGTPPIELIAPAAPVAEQLRAAELPRDAVERPPAPTLLKLSHLTFCKSVYGYGAYEPYDEARFSPADQLLLYVEVENYHSESTKDGFATKLGATYQILDERGERVDGGDFPVVEDRCRSRRRDFHIQYGLVLPDKIAPGKYQLRLSLRDLESDQVGQSTIGFEIGGSEP
jgi:hypothetical protein